jgi:aminoglycoside N3'-acetyltransferase
MHCCYLSTGGCTGAQYPKKKIITCGAPVIIKKERKWKEFKDYEDYTDEFPEIGKDFINERRNLVNLGFIGQAESQFFKQKDIVDLTVEWIEKNWK